MRVVFLANHYPRWAGDRSGVAVAALARALVRRGLSVRVVASTDERPGDSELDGVPVHRVKSSPTFCDTDSCGASTATAISSPLHWGALLRLWRMLRAAARRELAAGADLIHAHGWLPAGLASPPGVPLVLSVHGLDASLLRRSRAARSLARGLLHRAAAVTTISREVGSWIQSGVGRHVDPAHIHPMPIDARGYPWTRGGGGAVVIGRLVNASRMVLAIETTAVLVSNGHDLPLTIIGDGPGRPLLERRAAELGITSLIRFAGHASPEETRRILERADVLLFTARGDGTALPVFQGLISGVPVVACWDAGAAVDLVPASGAGRLSLPSPEALADSVLGLQADTDRLAIARLVGESWRARLAPDHVAEVCERWYRDALAV